jgi:hypothetical protein
MADELVFTNLDFQNTNRAKNLPNAQNAGDAVPLGQLEGLLERIKVKDNVRTAAPGNVNLAAPGANINALPFSNGQRFIAPNQTAPAENGIYIYNGPAAAATRAPDASTTDELEGAIVTVEEGTSAGVRYKQTQFNFALGTDPVIFVSDSSVPPASTTVVGVVELATQAEVEAGDTTRVVTGETLKNSSYAAKGFSQTIGDGSQTSWNVDHNFGARVHAEVVVEATGARAHAHITYPTLNRVTVECTPAPTLNQLRVNIAKVL